MCPCGCARMRAHVHHATKQMGTQCDCELTIDVQRGKRTTKTATRKQQPENRKHAITKQTRTASAKTERNETEWRKKESLKDGQTERRKQRLHWCRKVERMDRRTESSHVYRVPADTETTAEHKMGKQKKEIILACKRTSEWLSVDKELGISPDIDSVRVALLMNTGDKLNIVLQLRVDYGEGLRVDQGGHGEGRVSGPVVIITSAYVERERKEKTGRRHKHMRGESAWQLRAEQGNGKAENYLKGAFDKVDMVRTGSLDQW